MSLQQISSNDIATWDSLDDVAATLEKRGLKPEPTLGEDNELVLRLTDDDEFMVLIHAPPGETAASFKSRTNVNTHTGMVATDDFEEFTFITRIRTWDAHGQTKYKQLSFSKDQMTGETGEKNTILQKLNDIEFNKPETIFDNLYDTKQVVKAFYEGFEELRTELIQEVDGIPDDRGDAKQRYVQVTLDRMIFLYFIQEKGLLDHDTEYLHKRHNEFKQQGNVYEEFYDPLFFEILAEGVNDTDYGNLPYLNGGLFSKNPIEEEFEDARLGETADETAILFEKILSFLSDWNWNVDERLDIVDPKNLSPAILGHIFEQTVNQKEMGAYYTPEEITGFMSRRTIHPWLLDQVNETHGTEYEDIDDIFELDATAVDGDQVGAMADGGIAQTVDLDAVNQEHVKTLYFDALNELRVLDPAVGSGAFLLAAQEVLIDIYLQCIEYFQALRAERPWEPHKEVEEELDAIDAANGTSTLYAKNQIILNNLYGVDIDEGGVEICKLRLWLSMVADIENEPKEVEPLPNIDFNIRQGNSLIGFTELVEVNNEGNADLSNFGAGLGESVRDMYEDVISAVTRHRKARTGSAAAEARREAEDYIEEHSETLNEKVLKQFHDAGLTDVSLDDLKSYHPFHWVLEFANVYESGGFDVVIGNPPWDVLTPNRDDYFSKFDEVFRTRMPEDKDNKMEKLLSNDDIEEGWQEYQSEMERRATFFNDGGQYELQNPEVGGQQVGNENDLSMLFFERVFDIVREDGYVAQILPGVILNGAAGKDLRLHLLDNFTVRDIVGFENRGIFSGIHFQYRFGIFTFKNSGSTSSVRGIFDQTQTDILKQLNEQAIEIPAKVLKDYSPEARIFPNIETQAEVDVLRKLLDHASISDDIDGSWYASLYAELHRSGDSDRFVEDQQKGDYPVYQGKNVYQFAHNSDHVDNLGPISLWSVDEDVSEEKSAKSRIRGKNFRTRDEEISLKKAIYDKFTTYPEFSHLNTRSQKGFVNDLLTEEFGRQELSPEDVLLDSTEYRIVLREIARSTDERTLIAGVIPKGAVAVHTLHTVRPYQVNPEKDDLGDYPLHGAYDRVFSDNELFVALGLLNSIPFDYLMRTKVDAHIVKYKFEESQLPRLTDGDNWFHYISERAARLNCYGEEFAEMRDRLGGIEAVTDETERERLQAEIDAAAFHAYGLNQQETEFVLDDFHRVSNPRRMNEDYFELVFEKFTELAESGSHP